MHCLVFIIFLLASFVICSSHFFSFTRLDFYTFLIFGIFFFPQSFLFNSMALFLFYFVLLYFFLFFYYWHFFSYGPGIFLFSYLSLLLYEFFLNVLKFSFIFFTFFYFEHKITFSDFYLNFFITVSNNNKVVMPVTDRPTFLLFHLNRKFWRKK